MNQKRAGETQWVIPDAYIPPESTGDLISHESICVLNCNDETAKILITVYFEDRPPIEEIEVKVLGKRTNHIRTSSLEKNLEKIPLGVPYAIEIRSDLPIVVQYSRLDTTQPELALMSTMAYPLK